jgi:hypothetical protein
MCAIPANGSGVAIRSGRRAGHEAPANASRAFPGSNSNGVAPGGKPLHHGGVSAGMTDAYPARPCSTTA